jgi:hypothetical protein
MIVSMELDDHLLTDVLWMQTICDTLVVPTQDLDATYRYFNAGTSTDQKVPAGRVFSKCKFRSREYIRVVKESSLNLEASKGLFMYQI